jgi:ribosomal protein S12 methylthiotransferase accessory factor
MTGVPAVRVAALPGSPARDRLAEAVRETVASVPAVAVDVLVAGAAQADAVTEAAARAHSAGRCFLPIRLEPGQVAVGPLSRPGETGCVGCAQLREGRARNAAVEPGVPRFWRDVADGTLVPPEAPLSAATRSVTAALVLADLLALSSGQKPRSHHAVLEVTVTGAVTRHRFLPDPECMLCGELPADTPEAGNLVLVSRLKPDPGGYRLRDLTAHHDELIDRLVDPRCGVVNALSIYTDEAVVVTAAHLPDTDGGDVDGYGRTLDHRSSECIALAEALERLGGLLPRARRTTVRGSFAQLGSDRAIDPRTLGLPRQPPAAHGGHDTAGYQPHQEQDWVYGYSFRRRGPVLVPETIAYYGLHRGSFAFETSNGCALGSSLEEAILYGIFEVAERDGFLLTWYARLPIPRVDPWTCADPATRLLLSMVEGETGSKLHVFDATMPEGIPTLFLALVDEQDRAEHPKVCCGAAAHLDPERALKAGLLELASTSRYLGETMRTEWARLAGMVADPYLVTRMSHHSELYAMPEAWPRLDFLYPPGARMRTMAEAFPLGKRYRPAADLSEDLHHVCGRYLQAGLDVVVIDQSTVEHRAAGMDCVKVIIPGTLPMTFGHANRRAEGMPRLHTAPVRLGHRSTPLRDEDINPHPHPFP